MMRRLTRLFIIALLLAVVAYAASRLMGGDDDDDFDDFEDLDSGFEFQETPVEIDVPANEPSGSGPDASTSSASSKSSDTNTRSRGTAVLEDRTPSTADGDAGEAAMGSGAVDGDLVDINGIGPAYEARLQAIGITSIKDLASANADALASQIEVIGGSATIDDWINQAKSYGANSQS